MEVAARKQQLREDEEVARALKAVDVTPRRFGRYNYRFVEQRQ